MGARLRIFLTKEQDQTLLKLRTANVPQKVKDRALIVRLNAQGWYVEKIAAHFDWAPQTVREVLHKWQKVGMEGFWELPGRGGKPTWKEADIEFLTECLKNEPRTYNSVQLAQKLEQERSVKLSPDRLRRILKKKGFIWKRARKSHKGKQEIIARQIKQADLDLLEWSAAAGEIDLKYLAERSKRIRVIVQDNGPIHRCHEVQKLWSSWESQGLYILFLPKYCSEMNPIELEWQHLKKDELAG